MTLKETLKQLRELGNKKMYAQTINPGAGENQFGVICGDIRKSAKKIKINHELAIALWETENIDAQFLAILLIEPNKLSTDELDRIVQSVTFVEVADWLNNYVVKHHSDNETLRKKWMVSEDPMSARAGWSLTAGRVVRNPEGLDIPTLLDRIESEMGTAVSEAQWNMNSTLANIGINFLEHRERDLYIGEKLGIYRDYPVSKSCTSLFAPIWIQEMVRRQGEPL